MTPNRTAPTAGETNTEGEVTAAIDRRATVAELAIPAAEFALGETIAAVDGLALEIEQVVADDPGRFVPLVWASGGDRVSIECALRADSSVVSFEALTGTGSDAGAERLYRIEPSDRVEAVLDVLTAEGGTVLAAATTGDRWSVRLLLSDRKALARTHGACMDHGIEPDLARIYTLNDGPDGRFGLTDCQREALELATEHGYYRIPRETTAAELASVLGISHQAFSERLRRAHGNLVGNTITFGRSAEREK